MNENVSRSASNGDIGSRLRKGDRSGRMVIASRRQVLLADPAHTSNESGVAPPEPPVHTADAGQADLPKAERRHKIDPTTCERDYTADEIEFMKAMDEYKRRCGRPFPTWSEVLEVVRSLGYRRD